VLALAACETFGDVVDVGCGRGQLAVCCCRPGWPAPRWASIAVRDT